MVSYFGVGLRNCISKILLKRQNNSIRFGIKRIYINKGHNFYIREINGINFHQYFQTHTHWQQKPDP